jgi:hypothetical protein
MSSGGLSFHATNWACPRYVGQARALRAPISRHAPHGPRELARNQPGAARTTVLPVNMPRVNTGSSKNT